MSFDPGPIAALRELAPGLPRGIVAERHYSDSEWDELSARRKRSLAFPAACVPVAPAFLAYRVKDLPSPAPLIARHIFGLPLLTWTVRTRRRPQAGRTLGRPDDFRGLQAVNSAHDRRPAHPRRSGDRRYPGGRVGCVRQSGWIKFSRGRPITHSFHTIFCPPWKPRAPPRRGPAGSRSISSPRRPKARCWAPCPAYLKSHSRGEYVFDAGWAEAYERAGGSYYPKVQVSVPFTPATGRRLLVPAGDKPTASGRAWRAASSSLPAARRLLGACHLRAGERAARARRVRLPQAHRPAIPLGERELRDVRRFPRCARRAQAQDDQARAARCACERHRRCTGSPART